MWVSALRQKRLGSSLYFWLEVPPVVSVLRDGSQNLFAITKHRSRMVSPWERDGQGPSAWSVRVIIIMTSCGKDRKTRRVENCRNPSFLCLLLVDWITTGVEFCLLRSVSSFVSLVLQSSLFSIPLFHFPIFFWVHLNVSLSFNLSIFLSRPTSLSR